ncbi:MAG TPA: class I SAM-dependent methyltransferase [Planctomycetaceae bacterium]|nr:class I SAM-dependent methyltransferase [Planctomycetaceae bacterium]
MDQIRVSPITAWLDRALYPRHGDRWDDELFRAAVLERLAPDSRVLDLGAGRGVVRQMDVRGCAGRVCGVDPDGRVLENPQLDEARIGTGEAIPYPDGTFDVVFADNVLEHLAEPPATFREVRRVLKPGGVFLVKTPNRRHYVPTIARITPQSFHRRVNRRRGRDDADTFPTLYRANTPRALERLAGNAGLDVRHIRLIEGRPEYLRTFWPLYPLGWLYERLVNGVPGLSGFRVVMIAVFERAAADAAPLVDGCAKAASGGHSPRNRNFTASAQSCARAASGGHSPPYGV